MAGSKGSPKAKGGHKHQEVEYEFFGPIGATVLIFLLPTVAYGLLWSCGPAGCPGNNQITFSIDPTAAAVCLGWFFFQILLYYAVPGPYLEGVPLSSGKRLKYKINAHRIFWLSLSLLVAGDYAGLLKLSWVYHHFESLLLTSVFLSVSISVYVYVSSFFTGEQLAIAGNTGNHIYDFWMGRPLNPRIGTFDFKYFCELRPGLIGWVAINLAMAYAQYERLGSVSASMILVFIFEAVYVWDGLANEPALLTTMDITTEGFGYMLSFGDLTWVPFTYTLQARYLVDYPVELSPLEIVLIIAVYLAGLYIFRASNSQKDAFRKNPKDPQVAHLKTLSTKRGTKLLISGWWGTARHINYLGDWLMGLAYCLPCGFSTPIPYFYAIYFAVLLIHREFRDEHACKKKYGDDWDKYCKIVKYRIIPYVF